MNMAKAQKDNFLGGGSVKESEGLEARKAKIDGLWSDWDEIQKEPKLVSLFDRKSALDPNINPSELLYEHNYPERTKIADLQFENWTVNIDPKFVKDGYVYLMRGDHPGLDKKRILY